MTLNISIESAEVEGSPEPSVGPRVRWLRASPPDAITLVSLALIGSIIIYFRCPTTLRHPELFAEDGTVWFTNAYQSGPLSPLLSPHTGYLQTFPRLIADVGLLLPIRRLPLLFVAVAVLVQVLPAGLIASRRFASLIPAFPVRLVFSVAYLLAPNSLEVNANLTNAQWHLALIAFLVLIANVGGRWWRCFDVVAVVFCGLTGPFSIVLAPIGVVVWFIRRKSWTGLLSLIMSVAAVLQLICLLTSPRGTFAGLGITPGRLAEIMGGQIVGGTLIGMPATYPGDLATTDVFWSSILMAGGAVLFIITLWKGQFELKIFNIFAFLILCSSLAAPVASLTEPQWLALIFDPGARYWLFPTLALMADLLWLAGQVRMWRGLPALIGTALVVAVAVFGVRSSFKYVPYTPRPNWPAEVSAFEKLPPGKPYTFSITPGGWTFTIDKK